MRAIIEELKRHQVAVSELLKVAPPQVRAAMKLQEGHTRHTLHDLEQYGELRDHMTFGEVTHEYILKRPEY